MSQYNVCTDFIFLLVSSMEFRKLNIIFEREYDLAFLIAKMIMHILIKLSHKFLLDEE